MTGFNDKVYPFCEAPSGLLGVASRELQDIPDRQASARLNQVLEIRAPRQWAGIILIMKNLLFNSHDIVLTLVISLCLVMAIRPMPGFTASRATRRFLALFFLFSACSALDNLVFWGDAIKYAAFDLSPWLPTLFTFASFAMGPLLYWSMRSIISPDWSFRLRDVAQLLPAVATPVYFYWAVYQFPLEQQRALVLELSIFGNAEAYFLTFWTLKKLMPVVYGLLCVTFVLRHKLEVSKRSKETGRVLQLYLGFATIWLWVLLTHILGQWIPLSLSDFMGIFGNYLNLALVVTLLFSSVTFNAPTAKLRVDAEHQVPELEAAEAGARSPETVALADQIEKFIQTERPYLNPQLTLERFAVALQVSPRQVSHTINRCFRQNFHEYINRLRVEEAKRLLRDPDCQECTILEIAHRAGFNSKPTFNRFFKSIVGVTPSTYRGHPAAAELTLQGSHS